MDLVWYDVRELIGAERTSIFMLHEYRNKGPPHQSFARRRFLPNHGQPKHSRVPVFGGKTFKETHSTDQAADTILKLEHELAVLNTQLSRLSDLQQSMRMHQQRRIKQQVSNRKVPSVQNDVVNKWSRRIFSLVPWLLWPIFVQFTLDRITSLLTVST